LQKQCEALERKYQELEEILKQSKLPQENNNQIASYQELPRSSKYKECEDSYQKYQKAVYDNASKMLKNNCNPIPFMPFRLRANTPLIKDLLNSTLDEKIIIESLRLCFIDDDGGSRCDKSIFENINAEIEPSLNEEKREIWNKFKIEYCLDDIKPSLSPQVVAPSLTSRASSSNAQHNYCGA
jgi:hypothetical protein